MCDLGASQGPPTDPPDRAMSGALNFENRYTRMVGTSRFRPGLVWEVPIAGWSGGASREPFVGKYQAWTRSKAGTVRGTSMVPLQRENYLAIEGRYLGRLSSFCRWHPPGMAE